MARHLADVSDKEWEQLMDAVVAWLDAVDVPGSIGHDYNLYDALDHEREKAQATAPKEERP